MRMSLTLGGHNTKHRVRDCANNINEPFGQDSQCVQGYFLYGCQWVQACRWTSKSSNGMRKPWYSEKATVHKQETSFWLDTLYCCQHHAIHCLNHPVTGLICTLVHTAEVECRGNIATYHSAPWQINVCSQSPVNLSKTMTVCQLQNQGLANWQLWITKQDICIYRHQHIRCSNWQFYSFLSCVCFSIG